MGLSHDPCHRGPLRRIDPLKNSLQSPRLDLQRRLDQAKIERAYRDPTESKCQMRMALLEGENA